MYDRKTESMWFPHTVPGRMLDGKEYDINSINGGVKKIEQFRDADGNPYVKNSFWGGNVNKLGFIKELGFYACILDDKLRAEFPTNFKKSPDVQGFYVDKGEEVTEYGRQVLAKRFIDVKEFYWTGKPEVTKESQEEIDARNAILREAMNDGFMPETIGKVNPKELAQLVQATRSGKNPNAHYEMEQPVVSAATSTPARVKRRDLSTE